MEEILAVLMAKISARLDAAYYRTLPDWLSGNGKTVWEGNKIITLHPKPNCTTYFRMTRISWYTCVGNVVITGEEISGYDYDEAKGPLYLVVNV